MKRPTILLLLVCITFFSSCSTDNSEDTFEAIEVTEAPQAKQIEIEVLELINTHRISIGLNPLENMTDIKAQAYGHTNYMVDTGEVSHNGFYQRKNNLINNVGATRVGENVAYAYSSPQSVVNAWINSDSHRDVLEGDYTNFDISAEKDIDGHWYFTNIFIKK
jgi:uncharacterized protein YkwD